MKPGEAHQLIRHAAENGIVPAVDVLENFCKRAPENIQLMIKNIYIIDRYRKLSEMGQIRVLTLLYN